MKMMQAEPQLSAASWNFNKVQVLSSAHIAYESVLTALRFGVIFDPSTLGMYQTLDL